MQQGLDMRPRTVFPSLTVRGTSERRARNLHSGMTVTYYIPMSEVRRLDHSNSFLMSVSTCCPNTAAKDLH